MDAADISELEWVPPRGHNRPPPDETLLLNAEQLGLLLPERLADRAERAQLLLESEARFAQATGGGIPSEELAATGTDLVRQIKAAIKATDDQRREVKAPYLAAENQIDGAARKITDPLESACRRVIARVTEYLRRKEAEKRAAALAEAQRREEEAKRAAEAIELAAKQGEQAEVEATATAVAALDSAAEASRRAVSATPADLSRVRTSHDGVASLRQNWTFQVEDKLALLRAIVAGEVPDAYVLVNEQMLRALAKSQKNKASLPGVRFFNDAAATIR